MCLSRKLPLPTIQGSPIAAARRAPLQGLQREDAAPSALRTLGGGSGAAILPRLPHPRSGPLLSRIWAAVALIFAVDGGLPCADGWPLERLLGCADEKDQI